MNGRNWIALIKMCGGIFRSLEKAWKNTDILVLFAENVRILREVFILYYYSDSVTFEFRFEPN